MKINRLLKERRKEILDRWWSGILDTYPQDGARFLRTKKNRFSNPVGHTLSHEIEKLFDALIGEADMETVAAALREINNIRAVQDFTPSRAVAFVFFLKTAIRKELAEDLKRGDLSAELLSMESQIDGLALMAFDSYMSCRERLFTARCNDIRRQATLFAGDNKDSRKHRS